jgi:hypothetical protein
MLGHMNTLCTFQSSKLCNCTVQLRYQEKSLQLLTHIKPGTPCFLRLNHRPPSSQLPNRVHSV